MVNLIKKELEKRSNKEKAQILSRFFKTGKGQYGEGDIFLGVTVPEIRKVAKQFKEVAFSKIQELLDDKIHECRLAGLLILVEKYEKAEQDEKEEIFKLYLKNYRNINNWDLVDLSAPKIVGDYLLNKDTLLRPHFAKATRGKQGYGGRRKILYIFAKSNHIWKKRIAILATLTFIKEKQLNDTFKIAKILLNDKHDLIQKAVGWMLREAGKRDKEKEIEFLEKYASKMPRTMLRYAIEKFSELERKHFLAR